MSVLANASPNPVWNSSTASSIYAYSFNLVLFLPLNNASGSLFSIVDDSTVSANAERCREALIASRIFTVQVVPGAGQCALAGFACSLWFFADAFVHKPPSNHTRRRSPAAPFCFAKIGSGCPDSSDTLRSDKPGFSQPRY